MSKWFFQKLLPAQVETEITQRDQFSNDNVTLNETIVRETVQNSLDAGVIGENVKVTFRWLDKNNGLGTDFLAALLRDQLPHAQASGIDLETIKFLNPHVLVIEDFGTKGLTGSIDEKDNDNFSDFWRRHGKSHKSGKSRGRWGLGKLVYSTTSQLGVFFGLTMRLNDKIPRLMGQSVLNLYTYKDEKYLPHSFFADQTCPGNLHKNIPIPIKDDEFVSDFKKSFCLQRDGQSGLSIVIPFPNELFDQRSMIKVAIENYFYPIVVGQLSLVFDDIEINKDNIRALAHAHAKNMHPDLDCLFDFLEAVSIYDESSLLILRPTWSDDNKLSELDFEDNELSDLRERFTKGEICGIRLPLTLRTKGPLGKGDVSTFITVFIQRPEDIILGLDLYVRGGLTLPGECKFRSRRALGAMVADDEAICDFLGDAENPAHTQWNLATEKLGKKYVSPRETVRVIKNALINLYDLLAEVKEEKDDTALGQFFGMDVDEPESSTRKAPKKGDGDKGKKSAPVPDVPPLRKKLLDISEIPDGFVISTLKDSQESSFPASYRVTVAYDDGSSNPFKNYKAKDFSFGKGGKIKTKNHHVGLQKLRRSNRVDVLSDNSLDIHIVKPPFQLEVTGFDPYRDLKVSSKKVKTKIIDTDDTDDTDDTEVE